MRDIENFLDLDIGYLSTQNPQCQFFASFSISSAIRWANPSKFPIPLKRPSQVATAPRTIKNIYAIQPFAKFHVGPTVVCPEIVKNTS